MADSSHVLLATNDLHETASVLTAVFTAVWREYAECWYAATDATAIDAADKICSTMRPTTRYIPIEGGSRELARRIVHG